MRAQGSSVVALRIFSLVCAKKVRITMPEYDLSVTPFLGCKFLYQAVLKICEESGEVASAFYNADLKEAEELTDDDIGAVVHECGDVIQAAVNVIWRCGYDLQEVMDAITEKNIARGYYDA